MVEFSVSQDDRELVDNLRQKYAFQAGDDVVGSQGAGLLGQNGLNAAIEQQVAKLSGTCGSDSGCCPSRQRKTAQDVDVKMCPVCQGLGQVHEHYAYRVLQTTCTACDGDGVQTFGKVKKVVPDYDRKKSVWSSTVRERIAKLEDQIQSIKESCARYSKEVETHSKRLAHAEVEEERQSVEHVICQLQKHIASLEAALATKQEKLGKYRKSSTAQETGTTTAAEADKNEHA